MNKDELIAKQQLEIEEMKMKLISNNETYKQLHGMFYSIGAPLNDNILKMNVDQLRWCSKVYNLITEFHRR